MESARAYVASHPWITFKYTPDHLPGPVWGHLGEALSKCQHLIGTPLQPHLAATLGQTYFRRGALASAAIEGNTLSEADVDEILSNSKKLPESQAYLETEVRNVLEAMQQVREETASQSEFHLSPHWILGKHARLMDGIDSPEHVQAGSFRTVSVGVGTYRAVPAEDVEYLVTRLCEWINEMLDSARREASTDRAFYMTFFAATLSHLYLAWIHPFGDGNGRTARLVEATILSRSNLFPWISTNVLSDFYNKTRSKYYEQLDRASKARDVDGFIAYCALGIRDQLREQVQTVQSAQRQVAWINYVHECFQREAQGPTARRRRTMILSMREGVAYSRRDLRYLTPEIGELYESTSDRLMSRDLNRLRELSLIKEMGRGKYQAAVEKMDAFRPLPEAGAGFATTGILDDSVAS